MINLGSMTVNRPIIVKRGWDGFIESNAINAYVGEYAVFQLPLGDNVFAELRIPIDEGMEYGLIVHTDEITFDPDYDDDYEEPDLGDND